MVTDGNQTCGGEQTVVYTEVKLTAAHMELTYCYQPMLPQFKKKK